MKYVVYGLGFIGMFFPYGTAAQVVINEIAWMGTPVEGVDARQAWRHEWLELYNPADAAVRVDGWKVELYREHLDFEIALRGTVDAGGYFLIGASNKIPGVDVNYGSLAGKFVNSGQRVVLKNAAGEIVEEVDARSGWFAGDKDTKTTMERRFAERGANDAENWGSSMPTGGTLKEQNSLLGKEKFARLAPLESRTLLEQKTRRASFVSALGNPVFMRAFVVALAAGAAILVLRRYLARGEDSFGVRRS